MTGLGALFLAAFLAATLIPAQSEALLVALILRGEHAVWLLLSIATCGNVLGSTVNWALGRFLIGFQDRRWFPVSQASLARATRWYGRWGYASLWASWVPLIECPADPCSRGPARALLAVPAHCNPGLGERYLVLAWGALQLI